VESRDLWIRIGLGATAGLAGTCALQLIRKANEKWIPEGSPPMQGDPAGFMLRRTKESFPERVREKIPRSAEQALMKLLPLGYGMSFGALYATARPTIRREAGEGVLLGLICWAVGFLGWLPKTGLMPPIWEHKPKQIVRPIVEHALYGVATVEGYRWLKRLARA